MENTDGEVTQVRKLAESVNRQKTGNDSFIQTDEELICI